MTDTSNLPAKRMTATTKDTTAELIARRKEIFDELCNELADLDDPFVLAEQWAEEVAKARAALEALQAENERLRKAGNFALSHVFDPPEGWYPADVFLSDDRSIEEQLEAGRDKGPVYASKAREMLRAALKDTAP